MSGIGDAIKGIKQLLLIQKQIEDLEKAAEIQVIAVRDLGRDVVNLDKRVIRIETMIEMSGRGGGSPRIEG